MCNDAKSVGRDGYHYQKSIRYASSIYCFDSRYALSILICQKYKEKQELPLLMTGPPVPHFNMCKTSQDCDLVWNSTQSHFGVEFLGQKH